MLNCPECDRQLAYSALMCSCGWTRPAAQTQPAGLDREPPQRELIEPWDRRVAAYRRVEPALKRFAMRRIWTRAKFIEHWTAMINNPRSSAFQVQFAREALANLRSDETNEREPGEDDEELAA